MYICTILFLIYSYSLNPRCGHIRRVCVKYILVLFDCVSVGVPCVFAVFKCPVMIPNAKHFFIRQIGNQHCRNDGGFIAVDFREYRPSEKIHVLDIKKYGFYPKKHYIAFPYGFEPTLHRYRMQEPGKIKTPSTVFVCSMADLFGHLIPDEWIFEVFKACAEHPQHRYMFLTKNPMRYFSLMDSGNLPKSENMWYGTTITTETDDFFYADGYNSFLSIEPIQGPISFDKQAFRRIERTPYPASLWYVFHDRVNRIIRRVKFIVSAVLKCSGITTLKLCT